MILSLITVLAIYTSNMLFYSLSINFKINVVATTRWNGTRSLLTLAKLLIGYLVVGITRELDKEPSLY